MSITASVGKRFTGRADVNLSGSNTDLPAIREGYVDITFDSSYATGGEAIAVTDIDSNFSELLELRQVSSEESDLYEYRWDRSNGKIKAFYKGWADKVFTGVVTDDDDAASNGTALGAIAAANVSDPTVIDGMNLAALDSTTANNADALLTICAGGPSRMVDDNDSPAGVALYFDEDATDPCNRILNVVVANEDSYIELSGGALLKIKDDNDAATSGVALYFDDNGTNAYERLLFVSPTNADGSFETYGQVLNATDLSGETVRFYWKAI